MPFRQMLLSCIILLLNSVLSKDVLSNVYYNDVEINTGKVRGFLAEDGDYFAYLGIPYAAPPIGGLRYKAPIPPSPWKNTFIANRTVSCPQRGSGDENCLIVNVFTPTQIFNGPLPVLVYFHGGSFLIGTGPTKGVKPLIEQHLIIVTVNYRLGALGFLCLGIKEAPGNAGLKDQVAALKWVKTNIEKFGGDPNKVTIYGMSAGGASIEFLVYSDMAKGLFHNAIVESGTASAVWSIDADPIQTAKSLADSFDDTKSSTNLNQLVEFYQNIPAKELSKINYELYQNLTDGTFGFVPCLEKNLFNIQAFITKPPNDILRTGIYNKVAMLFMFATTEGLHLRSVDYYELNYRDKMNANFEEFMPADLEFDSEEIKADVTQNVRQFYFRNQTVGDNTLKEYLDYFGDQLILHGLLNSALAHSRNGDIVYLMEFAYNGKLGEYDPFFEDVYSPGHGDAVKYAILKKRIENNSDKLIVDRMAKIIGNFMKYGNPSPTRSLLIPIHWPAIQPDSVTYLHLDQELNVFEEPFWEKKIFWDKLYERYRKPIKPVDPEALLTIL